MKRLLMIIDVFVFQAVALLGPAYAQSTDRSIVLFQDVRIFDGKSEKLADGMSVLVEGNKIAKIAESIPAPESATVIEGGGRVMTPGFIDSHAHVMFQLLFEESLESDETYFAYAATKTAKLYLMSGFTTIRDVSGNSFSLKKAIDREIVVGPRIFPSGPMISQTSGHSDHRVDSDRSSLLGGEPDVYVRFNHTTVADGVPDVLTAVRENLRRGASQIKISVGGGTCSSADPLDVVEYTAEEIRAAVQAAEDWGTYVMAHVYNSKGIRRAIDNGVKSIEHGNLVDDATLAYMKEKGIWLSPQVIVYTYYPEGYSDDQKKKHDEAYAGIDHMFRTAKKIGFDKITFGSDIIADPEKMKEINTEFVFRTKWFTPSEILRQATFNASELLALSGPRTPYRGKIGVIEEGALADLLLINGNPLEDISILTTPEKSLALIMKDGKIYKNLLR
ncbi:MAG: amidohydrolase family protein [bacterium]